MTDEEFTRIALASASRMHRPDETELPPHHEQLRRQYNRDRATLECADATPILLAEIDRLRKQLEGVEGILADAVLDDGRYDLGVKTGVAKALAALEACSREDDAAGDQEGAIIIREAAAVVQWTCGPGAFPSHERMRKALADIVAITPDDDWPGIPILDAQKMARNALEGVS